MRSLVALFTCVGFLANATIAQAVEGATGAYDGVCHDSVEPRIEELGDLVRLAREASFASASADPRVVLTTRAVPDYTGPRDFAKPARFLHQFAVSIVTDPYGERLAPLTVLVEQYQSLKDTMRAYDEFAGSVGDSVGQFHAQYMTVGPRWAKDADAALWSAIVRMNFGVAAMGPNLILYPEALFNAPGDVLSGTAIAKEGFERGQYDLAAKGIAQAAGGIGVLASIAGPLGEGFIGRTTPVSIRVPVAPIAVAESAAAARPNSAGAMAKRVYEASPKHPAWERGDRGNISKAPKNGAAALENSVEVNDKTRVGIDYETGEFVVLNRTHPHGEVWHGHVRTWEQVRGGTEPLNQNMQNALKDAERVNRNGKIIDAPNWAPEPTSSKSGARR